MAKYTEYYLFNSFGELLDINTMTNLADSLGIARKTLRNAFDQGKAFNGHLSLFTAEQIKELGFKALYEELQSRDQRWYCLHYDQIFVNKSSCEAPIKANQVKSLYNGE